MTRNTVSPELIRHALEASDVEARAVLRGVRKRLGISQQEFADRLGLGAPTLSKYERGKVNPSMDKLADLLCSPGLGLPQADIIGIIEQSSKAAAGNPKLRVAVSHNIQCSAVLVAANQNFFGDRFLFSTTFPSSSLMGEVPWSGDPLAAPRRVVPADAKFTNEWFNHLQSNEADYLVGSFQSDIPSMLSAGVICENKRSKVTIYYDKGIHDQKNMEAALNAEFEHFQNGAVPSPQMRDRFFFRFLRAFRLSTFSGMAAVNDTIEVERCVPIFLRRNQVSGRDFWNFAKPWSYVFEKRFLQDGHDYGEIAREVSRTGSSFLKYGLACVVYWEPFSSYYFKELEKKFGEGRIGRIDLKSSHFYESRGHDKDTVSITIPREKLKLDARLKDLRLFFEGVKRGIEDLRCALEEKDEGILTLLENYYDVDSEILKRDLKAHIYDMRVSMSLDLLEHVNLIGRIE